MLFYRLILLSWVASNNVLDGSPLQTRRLESPEQVGEKREESPYEGLKTLRESTTTNRHAAAQSNVIGRPKSLMTQVIKTSLRQNGGHPRKFIDFLDNGAEWHHFISKPTGHNSELRIHEGNFRVNWKYGNHDMEDADNRRNHHPDMYAGEAITGENSLSKFTAPPIYDEDAGQFQHKAKLDLNYEADTPEAAATEKQNTEQFVNRLHALMPPLGVVSYDFDKGRKEKHKLLKFSKQQEERIMDQDEDDLGNNDYPSLTPSERCKISSRKESCDEEQKSDKPSDVMGRKYYGRKYGTRKQTEDMVENVEDDMKKYDRGSSLVNRKAHGVRNHGQHNERHDNDGGETKATGKEQLDEEDSSIYKVIKDIVDDRNYQEKYDPSAASPPWSRKTVTNKHAEEDERSNNTEREYEESKKDPEENADDY